jgi:hypothetical protein
MTRSLGLHPALSRHATVAADGSRGRSGGDAPPLARQLSGDETPGTSPSPLGHGDHRDGRDGRDRMAERMNDVVVRRMFAAGLDLQAALGLIEEHGTVGEHPTAMEHRAASKIRSAGDELDRAIRDLRDILYEGGRE